MVTPFFPPRPPEDARASVLFSSRLAKTRQRTYNSATEFILRPHDSLQALATVRRGELSEEWLPPGFVTKAGA